MRWWLVLVAVGAVAVAGYFEKFARTSYSSYSEQQLVMLEGELGQQMKKGRESERIFMEQMLQQERARRSYVRLATGVAGGAGLAAVGAFLLHGLFAWRERREARRQEERQRQSYGGFSASPQEARKQAAALLGVTPTAPPAVIEAALEAQLRERDLSRMDGLAPDLQRMMVEQRAELQRARDLLLERS